MPTEREREYYSMGYSDGRASTIKYPEELRIEVMKDQTKRKKRKLSAWNKFVQANSKKPRFRFANGKLKLKQMGIAFRKTPAGKKRK